jgi:hypothetical protein
VAVKWVIGKSAVPAHAPYARITLDLYRKRPGGIVVEQQDKARAGALRIES